jgi:hypothetical protein
MRVIWGPRMSFCIVVIFRYWEMIDRKFVLKVNVLLGLTNQSSVKDRRDVPEILNSRVRIPRSRRTLTHPASLNISVNFLNFSRR